MPPATPAILVACLMTAAVGCQGQEECNGVRECVSSQAEADRLNAGSQCPSYAYCPAYDGSIDATTDSGNSSDATADSSADDADGGVQCSSPLANPGFSSLAELPIAQLCAQSWMGLRNLVELAPCQGIIEVDNETGTDCGELWLFDAATGALVAAGNQCNGSVSCTAAPGFRFPTGCTGTGWTNLCPDSGSGDGGGPDVDAAGE